MFGIIQIYISKLLAIGVFDDYLFCTPLNYLGHNTHNYWLIPILFIFALYSLFPLNISFCFFTLSNVASFS